eukprot:Opistho-2@13156
MPIFLIPQSFDVAHMTHWNHKEMRLRLWISVVKDNDRVVPINKAMLLLSAHYRTEDAVFFLRTSFRRWRGIASVGRRAHCNRPVIELLFVSVLVARGMNAPAVMHALSCRRYTGSHALT